MNPQLMRLILVDDHGIVRKGLLSYVQQKNDAIQVLDAENFLQLKKLLHQHEVDHVITDLSMPDCALLESVQFVRNQYPDIRVLVFTMVPFELVGEALIKMGAAGYLSKSAPPEEIQYAVSRFLEQGTYFPGKRVNQENNDMVHNPFSRLSTRELAVASYLMRGLSIKEIAYSLGISPTAVTTYKARMFNKLKVSNLPEMFKMANIFTFPS